MMIKNGARRRTPGGLYLQLLRDISREDVRVDPIAVKMFFNSTQDTGKRPCETM